MQYSFIETKSINPKPTKLAVLLHGVGSDAKDLAMIIPHMQKTLPSVHFIALNGIQPYDMANFGYQWFSFKDRSPESMQTQADQSLPLVMKFLQMHLDLLGLDFSDLFLIGFSQGTMLATHIGMYGGKKMAGIVGFAGSIIPPRKQASGQLSDQQKTPICFIHGAQDNVLSIDIMRQSADFLSKIGFTVYSHEIQNLTHSIDMRSIQIANNFILELL